MHNAPPIKVSEIFGPTIQGEGSLIGQPTVFVRTGGCDFRCHWCDSLHAVESSQRHHWEPMSVEEIWQKIEKLSGYKPILISLSGGNPAIQPLERLIDYGKTKKYSFAMETQGSLFKPWFGLLDTLIVSPKPPSSKMENNWEKVAMCLKTQGPSVILKIPVADEEDYFFARQTAQRFPFIPCYLQPVNLTPPPLQQGCVPAPVDMPVLLERFRWLIERTLQDQWYEVHLLPQLHVLIWGNQQGV